MIIAEFDMLAEIDPYKGNGALTHTVMDIDPERNVASVYQRSSGDGTTLREWHGRIIPVKIVDDAGEQPDPDGLRVFLESSDGQAMLEEVSAGYEAFWDGSNMVGRLNEQGLAALAALEADIANIERDPFETWTCAEWFGGEEGRYVDADSTASDIAAVVNDLWDVALADRQRFADDMFNHLERYVERLREQQEDE